MVEIFRVRGTPDYHLVRTGPPAPSQGWLWAPCGFSTSSGAKVVMGDRKPMDVLTCEGCKAYLVEMELMLPDNFSAAMKELHDNFIKHSHATPMGPAGPPIVPSHVAIKKGPKR